MSKPGEIVFVIEAKHAEEARHWIKGHPCRLRGKPEKTTIGGRISFTFCNTSIGQIQNVECACGKSVCLNGHDL